MAEVKILLTAEDKASAAFAQAAAGVKNFSSACKEAQHTAFEFIKGLAGWEGIKKIAEWMKEFYGLGAKALQSEESFRAVTASFNVNADSMLSKMKQVSKGMVDESNMMQTSMQGLILGLQDDQIVNLLEASRNAAKVLGQDVASTFDSIVIAVGGGVRAMGPLVRMGLITKEQFELLNKAIAAGVEGIDLYRIVLANAAIQKERFGNAALDAAEKLQKSHAQIRDIKEAIGKGLIIALQKALGFFQLLSSAALTLAGGLARVVQYYGELGAINPFNKAEHKQGWKAFAQEWKTNAEAFRGASDELYKQGLENITGGEKRADDLIERQKKAAEAKKELAELMKGIMEKINAPAVNELANAIAELENKLSGMNPSLNETGKALSQWEDVVDGVIRKIEQMDPQKISDAMKADAIDKVLQIYGKGFDRTWEADAKKAAEGMYQAQKESAEARETLMKELTLVNASELDKLVADTEDWAKKQHELNFKSFTDILAETGDVEAAWKIYEDNRTNITAAAATKMSAYVDEYFKKQKDSYLESMSGLATAYEQATELTRQWGETDEEYTKRVLVEKMKWKDLLIDGTKQLMLTGDIGSEAYDKIKKKLEELGVTVQEVNKTFEQGAAAGMKEYINSLEYGFDKGKALTTETATTLMSSFQTMFFDNFQKGLDGMLSYFKNTLAKMVTEALMKPIVVEISASFTSILAGMKDALSQGGASLLNLFGIDATTSGVGNLIGIGAVGYAVGASTGNKNAGSLAAAGAMFGSYFGPIGTVIGTIIGAIVGWLTKKVKKIQELGLAYSETGDFPDLKYGGTYVYDSTYGFATGGGSGDNITESEKKSVLKSFKEYRDDLKKVFSDLNLDVSGFSKTWSETFDTEGLSSDELQTKMKNMFADYASFATGVDFSKFQASGEELSDTVDRIVGAMAQIVAVIKQTWDETSQTGWDIQKMYDSIDIHANTYKESLDKIDSQITDAVSSLGSLTGEAWGNKIAKIGDLLADRYDKEVEYLTYIKGLQESIADDIQNFKDTIDLSGMSEGEKLTHYFNKALEDYNAIMKETDPTKISELTQSLLDSTGEFVSILQSLKDRIKSLMDTIKQNLETMQTVSMSTYEIAVYYWDKSLALANSYLNATDIEDKIKYGELLTGSINDLFNSLESLQGAFDNLKESADKTLRSMRMSMMSPTQKIDYINTEFTSAYSKYQEAKAAGEYGKMTYYGQKLIDLANEGWSLGINQQESFANLKTVLEEVSQDMADASQAATDVIRDVLVPALEYLQNELLNLSDTIDEALNAVKDALTSLNTTIQDTLVTAINAEITALNALRAVLNSIDWSTLGGGSGGSGGSGGGSGSAYNYAFSMSEQGYFRLNNPISGVLKYDTTVPDYAGQSYLGYAKINNSQIEFYDASGNYISAFSWENLAGIQYAGGYALTPHAAGLDYVPYDNYGALLHKGEAVVTARGNEALTRALDRLERIEGRLNKGADGGQTIVLYINGDLDKILDITAEELEGRVIKTVRRNPAVLTGR